jgi:anionic cell wall polymer biosynthesis LytR-Cps2A-Psr (LCP) family protein
MGRRAWVLLFLSLTVVSVLASGLLLTRHYDSNVERFGDPFVDLDAGRRPVKATRTAKSMTFLVLGSDSRISAGDPTQWRAGAQRTDAIMLLHVPADRQGVDLVSIPRDSWVEIPDHGRAKINAAFSYGGPSLMVATVERLTSVRIDHVVIADFTGFTTLTDALGGVRLGPEQMDGAQALAYVRQRHGLPGGDLDRVRRQQAWMRAVADKLIDEGGLTNPLRLNRVMNDVTQLLAVDDRLTGTKMRSTALSLRHLHSSDIRTATAPVRRTGWEGQQNVVYLADDEAEALWRELRTT